MDSTHLDALARSSLDLLNDHEKSIYQKVVDFCIKEVDPFCEQWEKEENLPREIFTKAGRLGLMGIVAPKELGGLNLRYVAYALIIERLSQSYAALGLDIAAHNALSVGHILAAGSEEQKKQYVPRLVSGEWIGAWGLTEPHAGSDTGGIETIATKTADGWELNGHKRFITQGMRADITVVIAASGTNEKGKKEISAFLVKRDQVKHIRKIPTYGVKASDTAELEFVKSKAEQLGELGHGQEKALAILERGRIGVAAFANGVARAAFDAARKYALQRKQFGKAIAEFEAVQWMLADSAVELDAGELLTLRAAMLQDKGLKTGKESAMAKLYTSEMAVRICNRALQIHGGYGYTRDLPIERYLRDAKIAEIGEGTSEVQRLVIARHVLKEVDSTLH
jgi:alkylation response protein AidB-like acyl-CoA dehydrogenase